MTVPKPTLTAYSPGDPVGFMVSAANYDAEVLQQGARTQLLIEPVTAFPASPALTDWCVRSDLNALFQCTNATGPVWTQMSMGAFTTATRPVAPPTNYRYRDLTDNFTYRYNGSAYEHVTTRLLALNYVAVADVTSGLTAVTTYTTIVSAQSFTLEAANGVVELELAVGGFWQPPAGGGGGVALVLFVDGTTRFNASRTTASASQLSPLSSSKVVLTNLAAGAHTVAIQYWANVAGTLSIQPTTNSAFDSLRLYVWEAKP